MPRLSQAEIRNNAIAFVHEWKDETRERAESQTFWNEFLEIFGVKRRQVAVFERAVQKNNLNTGAIDLFWRGVLLVEHKSRGQNFDKASSQAFEYLENLPKDELPEYVLISDFARFRLYNLDTGEEMDFTLEELPGLIHLFGAISGYQKREYKEQDPVNIRVALKLGELHDALFESGYRGHKLEAFLVRLVYCLFADDTGVFLPRGSFQLFLQEKTADDGSNLGAMLGQIFQVLDTPEDARQTTLDEDLRAFQYVNGTLFAERMDMPSFDRRMRTILIEACQFDWGKVSPAIFGSLFQSVMDKDKRRNLGAHYTSEKNILKVIHGLFMDDLLDEFEKAKNNLSRLRQFHEKIAGLKFFDPACGSGNFLVITYREMRRLELEVIKQERHLTKNTQREMLVTDLSRLDVDSFYGIEYEEFPAEIARVALWLTDHLANMELSAEFGVPYTRLPLRHSPNIINDNALRLYWPRIFDFGFSSELYVLGNPPFIGKQFRSDEQNADMDLACANVLNYRTLDYVCAWYIKATEFLMWNRDHNLRQNGGNIKVAFVSTNSITQGEQVGVLWNYLLEKGIKIHFAHRTFKWSNEAAGKAAVFCVIIGFGIEDVKKKRLFDYENPAAEPQEIEVKNINPYLIDFPDIVITNRTTPISYIPNIRFGNQPIDGGHLILSDEEAENLVTDSPQAAKFLRRYIGSREFLNGNPRWCLWLKDASPSEIREIPGVRNRVEAVRDFRLSSNRKDTRELAKIPYLFAFVSHEDAGYIIIPSVSSERRLYVPIGFLSSDVIASNLCLIVQNATLYHFGVLTSTMHNAWMRQVCGRLKGDYRYSNNLVYNNFPWPEVSDDMGGNATVRERAKSETGGNATVSERAKGETGGNAAISERAKSETGGNATVSERANENKEGTLVHTRVSARKALVEQTAQAILDARAKFPDATLADLYDPLTMPKELLDAHRANDAAVDAAYGKRTFKNELERLEFLFGLYRQITEPLRVLEEKTSKQAKRKTRRKETL